MKPETKGEGTQQEPTWDHFEHKPPVYKVIATFPGNSDFPVGKEITFVPWNTFYWAHQIEDCKGKREWLVSFFDQYPQIFQPQQEQTAPVQDSQVVSKIDYDSEEWKELKWDLGQIFQQHIAFSKSGAIEGNPAIHRMAEYAWKYRRLNFDLQSHPHPQQVVLESEIYDAGVLFVTTDLKWPIDCEGNQMLDAWKAAIKWYKGKLSGIRWTDDDLDECWTDGFKSAYQHFVNSEPFTTFADFTSRKLSPSTHTPEENK